MFMSGDVYNNKNDLYLQIYRFYNWNGRTIKKHLNPGLLHFIMIIFRAQAHETKLIFASSHLSL